MRKLTLGVHSIELHSGNITRQHTQAIVAGTDVNFHDHSNTGNSVHWHIARMPGGQSAMKALHSGTEKNMGDVRVGETGLSFSGKDSHIEKVYHVAIFDPTKMTHGGPALRRERPATAQSIHLAVKNVLELAMKDGISHVSIPAMGTGGSGATMQDSVYATLAAVRDHYAEFPNSKVTARLVLQTPANLESAMVHVEKVRRLGKSQKWNLELLKFNASTGHWEVHE